MRETHVSCPGMEILAIKRDISLEARPTYFPGPRERIKGVLTLSFPVLPEEHQLRRTRVPSGFVVGRDECCWRAFTGYEDWNINIMQFPTVIANSFLVTNIPCSLASFHWKDLACSQSLRVQSTHVCCACAKNIHASGIETRNHVFGKLILILQLHSLQKSLST